MKQKLIIGALLASFSFASLADNPTFNYFDIGYVTWRPDGATLSNSLSGLEINASKTINENFYLSGDLNYVSINSTALSLITAGAGYMSHISDTTSLFAELNLAYVKPENISGEAGYEATFGIRSMATEQLELKGAVEYLDISGGSDDAALVLGTAYLFSEQFGAYFNYKINEDIHRFSIGIRTTF